MKIVFLNTLDAEITEPLRDFLQTQAADTDVFCLQECHENMQHLLKEWLPEFTSYLVDKRAQDSGHFTNATLVRDTLPVAVSSSNQMTPNVGLSLLTTVHYENKEIHIANIHGLSEPGKLDTPERIQQSQEILNMFAALDGISIIGGDLNVLLGTESVRMFDEVGYKNLIRDFDIKTTRNEIAWKNHPGNELYYSDYVFVKGATVTSFEVPSEIVSDHQPMILSIDLSVD